MKYDSQALKIRIKLATSRINLHMEKYLNSVYGRRKEIADLLRSDHQERAMIQTKHLIKDDFRNEALEMIQDSLSDILQSLNFISSSSSSLSELEDSNLIERIKSVIWASNRVDIPEMIDIKKMLIDKFSKSNLDKSITIDQVDPRLVFKLTSGGTSGSLELCNKYMQVIAENFGVEWNPISISMQSSSMSMMQSAQTLPLPTSLSSSPSSMPIIATEDGGMVAPPAYNIVSNPQSFYPTFPNYNASNNTGNVNANVNANSNSNSSNNANVNIGAFDDITKRFEKLRQKK